MVQFVLTLPPFPPGSCLWYQMVPEQVMLADPTVVHASHPFTEAHDLSTSQPGDHMEALTIGDLRLAGSSDTELREYLGIGETDELEDDMLVTPVCL